MSTIATVIRKELLSTLRDRKTLFSAILLPALAMPLLLIGIGKLQGSLKEKERTRELKVALFNAPAEVADLFAPPLFAQVQPEDAEAARDSVEAENFDALLVFEPAFHENASGSRSGRITLYHKSTQEGVDKRVRERLDLYEQRLMDQRIQRLGLEKEMLDPVVLEPVDVASTKEQIGVVVGGMLPYLFIIFCFTGCMYPALDMVTGEKEKGTIETLLTTPTSRFGILLGKMLTIALVGLCAALMVIGGLVVTLQLATEIPAPLMDAVQDILSLRFVLMLFAMLIPLSLFFAGMISAVAIRASSFKEAQSYVTPLMFVVIVPAMVALMPGVKLTWALAFVPILNIALATKEIIAGTMYLPMYLAIVVSLVLLALVTVFISKGQFDKEGNILK